MPAVFVIAGKDLRQRLRDRSAIVIGLIAPLLIAGLMSVAFKGTESFHLTLGVVNADHGPVAAGLVKALDAPSTRSIVSTKSYASESAARAAVHGHHLAAALIIPAGFSASVATAHPESLAVVTSVNNEIAGNVAEAIVTSFAAQINADRLAVYTALQSHPSASASELASLATNLRIPLQAIERPIGAHELTAISYFSPAMAIFFLLFTISFTSRSFFVDRGQGMVERMRAAPVRPIEILAGKALSVLVYGTISLATVAVITSLAFGARWGNPLAAALLGLAMVISVVCLTAMVIGLARNQRQAEGISSAIIFGLALLGGNFISISSSPPLLRTLSLFTPNGWALRGYTDLSTIGGGVATVVTPILAILAISLLTGSIAASLAKRAVS
ncbi:MAG: ABC transporter permease [Acidimicrobiales bacterium]